MGIRQRGRCRRAVRRLLAGAGPLKRATDRVEMTSRLVVLLLLVATVPLALASARVTQHHLATVVARQAAERHPARAVIVRAPRMQPDSGYPDFGGPMTADAVVRWPTPTGQRRTASLLVPVHLSTGDTVTVGLTRDGALTSEPLDPAVAWREGIGVALMVAFDLPVTAWGSHEVLVWLLDRRRMRQWTTGRLVVGPVRTARRR